MVFFGVSFYPGPAVFKRLRACRGFIDHRFVYSQLRSGKSVASLGCQYVFCLCSGILLHVVSSLTRWCVSSRCDSYGVRLCRVVFGGYVNVHACGRFGLVFWPRLLCVPCAACAGVASLHFFFFVFVFSLSLSLSFFPFFPSPQSPSFLKPSPSWKGGGGKGFRGGCPIRTKHCSRWLPHTDKTLNFLKEWRAKFGSSEIAARNFCTTFDL